MRLRPLNGDRADAGPRTADDGPIVRVEQVHKSFGAQVVLADLTLDIRAGQTTVVLGPSGAGKSVLLKHIVGLLRPDRGRVYFKGERVDDLSEAELRPVRRHVGFLFQMSALFDSMNVEDNLAFPLVEHTTLTKPERQDRIASALKTVGLDGVQAKLPAELSGGQRKRVALARAIILEPALILYDEPTTGLDPLRADGINDLILKLRDELGISGIVVTHDLASAKKVGDRLVLLHGGNVIADGTYRDIERSDVAYVRHFLSGRYDPAMDETTTARAGGTEAEE